jgi:hypothetical protein
MYSFNSGTRHLFIKILGICVSVIGNIFKSLGVRYIKFLLTVSFLILYKGVDPLCLVILVVLFNILFIALLFIK